MKPAYKRVACTTLFIAAQFTTAEIWSQSSCPSMDNWRKKMWYVYIMEYYSAIEKIEIQFLQQNEYNWKPLCLLKLTNPQKADVTSSVYGNQNTECKRSEIYIFLYIYIKDRHFKV